MTGDTQQTRRRILEAADDLFYSEGFSSVSMDEIAKRAGVTKKTLYYHFRSKDDLFSAYVEARNLPTLQRYQHLAGTSGTVSERLSRLFSALAVAADKQDWRGCGFLRVAGELANLPGHPAVVAARAHKKGFEAWLATLLAEEGYVNAKPTARQMMILLDGAVSDLLLHRDAEYALSARDAALSILSNRGMNK